MSRSGAERGLTDVVAGALRRWLARARVAVMKPYQQYRMMPSPDAVFSEQGAWNNEVDTILTEIGKVSMQAWSEASDVPAVSRHAFVMAQLAVTQNLLVRIPDEVYNLIFAEITDGVNAGEGVDQVAQRVSRVLDYTASERWPGRARTIAQTETTRAYGAATVAAGLEQSRVTGRILRKRWVAHRDERTRVSHNGADDQTQILMYPFIVGGEQLMFPGDPLGSPENVINCRCSVVITNG